MKYLILFLIPWLVLAECIEEKTLSGLQLKNLKFKENYYVEIDSRFINLINIDNLIPSKSYQVQVLERSSQKHNIDYNDKYLNYYGLNRFKHFLKKITPTVQEAGYLLKRIGGSVKARDLFVIRPLNLDPGKKTILMFVRHHGDEGTSNWVFEGFIKDYLKNSLLLRESQLIVYPMVNPDGVYRRTRYNANGLDLNRTWGKMADETKVIYNHLKGIIDPSKIDFLLDMHGHKSKDIIYRVAEDYISDKYFNQQSEFIETLGQYDSWQNGNYIVSNGKIGMSRIFFAHTYDLNSLTHETLKNILRDTKSQRTIGSLKEQGRALNLTLIDYLYGK